MRIGLREPTRESLLAFAEEAGLAGATYVQRADGAEPAGFGSVRRLEVLGRGDATYQRAANALLGWEMHDGAGIRVAATSPTPEPEAVVGLGVRIWPVWISAACEVVDTRQEARAAGFTYVTLVGHPEIGIEKFAVELGESGIVTFTVEATSKAADALVRAINPVAKRFQRLITDRYFASMRSIAGSG